MVEPRQKRTQLGHSRAREGTHTHLREGEVEVAKREPPETDVAHDAEQLGDADVKEGVALAIECQACACAAKSRYPYLPAS